MRSRLITFAVLVSLLTGCANVREVDLDSGGSQLADINAAAKGKRISAELASGETRTGMRLDLGPDRTCWTEGNRPWMGRGDEEQVCVPTSDVRRIIVHRRLRGCFQGAGIGLGGTLAAAVAVLMAMPPVGDEHAGQGLMFLVAAAAGVSTVVGTVIGVGRGKDVYILRH